MAPADFPTEPSVSGGGGRPAWAELPATLRGRVETLLGSPVVASTSRPGGFSPGSADRLRTAAGGAAFVKAVSAEVNPESIGIHRREAEVLAALPPGLPVAPLLGVVDDGDWVALVLEYIEGRHPVLPWRPEELARVLDAFAALAAAALDERLTATLEPLPGHLPTGWSRVDREAHLALPAGLAAWSRDRLPELQALEARAPDLVQGDRLVHLDARADNVLLRPDGSVVVVDWPWAVRGAAWFDPLLLLVNVRLFDPGFDVAAVIRGHAAFAGLPEAAVPAVLAALAGFFTERGSRPAPPGLPTLRRFQLDQAEVTLQWLQEAWPD